MLSKSRRAGVLVVDAARFNAMQGICDAARIWNRSKGEEKSRAERSLLRALSTLEELALRDEEE
jgi:hypothetical protein